MLWFVIDEDAPERRENITSKVIKPGYIFRTENQSYLILEYLSKCVDYNVDGHHCGGDGEADDLNKKTSAKLIQLFSCSMMSDKG